MSSAAGNLPLISTPVRVDVPPDVARGFRVVRVPPEWRLAAAARLVGDQAADPFQAAQRFLDSAAHLGIDPGLLWATTDVAGSQVRQVCLAVNGPGRTAMLFVSGPAPKGRTWRLAGSAPAIASEFGSAAQAHAERVALVEAACEHVAPPGDRAQGKAPSTASGSGGGARLAQALLERREREAIAALRGAGFTQLGDLAYMRRPCTASMLPVPTDGAGRPRLPGGVRLVTVAELIEGGASAGEIDALLLRALERTYVDTQDCPELCGLRAPEDVLASHRSVGVNDPHLWWLVFENDRPEGCMLFSVCPEQDSVELVYLGVAPQLRGRGLASVLLALGVNRLIAPPVPVGEGPGDGSLIGVGGVTCAVDTRNAAAMRLYRRAGFQRFGVRVPVVKSLVGARGGAPPETTG